MASDRQEWSVPPAARALLWWPAAAFALVVVAPDTAGWSIALAGLVLALVGAVGALFVRRPAAALGRSAPSSISPLPAAMAGVPDGMPVPQRAA